MAAISELLCDVTVLTQGNHDNEFTAQVQLEGDGDSVEVAQRGCGHSMVSSDWSAYRPSIDW